MDTSNWRTLQIMPAGDWFAGYSIAEGEITCEPLVGWALVEDISMAGDAEARFTVGLIASMEPAGTGFAEDGMNLEGYYHRSELQDSGRGVWRFASSKHGPAE